MLYSVIIPTTGKSPYLKATLDSIVAQDVGAEIIVVDDAVAKAEMDKIRQCVSQFDVLNIKVIRSTRRGLSAACNTGISHAKGDILFFCHDDDIWNRDRIRIQSAIISETKADFHLANYCNIDEAGCRKELKSLECFDGFPENLGLRSFVPPSGWAIRRSVFEKIGLFDESFPTTEDKDYFIRAAQKVRIVRSGPILWSYRIHSNSMSRNLEQKALCNEKLISKHRKILFSNIKCAFALLDFSLKLFSASKSYGAMRDFLLEVFLSKASFKVKVEFSFRLVAYQIFRRKILQKVS